MCVCTQTPHTCARHEGTGLWESYEHQGSRLDFDVTSQLLPLLPFVVHEKRVLSADFDLDRR